MRAGCGDVALIFVEWCKSKAETDSHVAIGVDATVFLHILHLCWVNMLNLLNSLGLARQIARVANSLVKAHNAQVTIDMHTHIQWCKVTKYIYSSTVLKYNLQVLYMSISMFCYFILGRYGLMISNIIIT